MKNLTKRAASLLLALFLLAGQALAAAPGAETVIAISSVSQLEAFAKYCSLDTWSQGKTVRLTADLDLSGAEFTPIPTFGGTFLGENHKITGLRVTAAGSSMGLFRYLQEGAVVQDLTVTGTVRPGGSAANVGGIVGDNAGSVRNCAFRGTVEGSSAVGGVAGRNLESGELALCSSSGNVTGQEFTGGVAGRNLGSLLQCENAASVNTNTPDQNTGMGVEEMEALANSSVWDGDGGFLKSHSDTGGIAGYSSGILYSCRSTGTIGYPHVGYNVGGVAGRQCGHLSGCINLGQVYGRKDVGGIVGQAEPDVALSADGSALDRLQRELDTLESLIDRALDRTEKNTDGVSARLSVMGAAAGTARDHTKDLLDQLSDFTDGNIDSINSLSAAVTKALDDLTPALDELSDVSGQMETLANRLEDALNALGSAAEDGGDLSDSASRAAGIFRQAGETLAAAARDLRGAVSALKSAVVVRDQEAVDAAAADFANALGTFAAAMTQAVQAMEALQDALKPIPALEEVRTILTGQLIPALIRMGAAYYRAEKALGTIRANTGLDWAQLRAVLKEAGAGFGELESASQKLNEALSALQNTLGGLSGLSGRLGGAVRELADAVSLAGPMGRGLERAFRILKTVAGDLDDPIPLTHLGEGVRTSSRGLFDALTDFSQELEDVHEAVSQAGDQLTADLRAVSRQFNVVFSVLLDTLSDARDGGDNRDLVEDASDENTAATRYGKVENCRNAGPVDGDRNVGGVVGAMSIEYGLDPEGDLELSLGGTYETRAVLQGSVNHGPVTAKKDCAGGLAGRMDLGAALGCENYGPVTSTGGGCVGGVAGYAGGVVRESFAKCSLSGTEDVGGIAGWADRLRSCYAIATILEGAERVGAIAGSGELANIENNFFIDTGTAGIDGVSYAGIAQPIAFDELLRLPDIPAAFSSFTLTLKADEETIREIPFTYGQDLSKIELPPVPEREGFYGAWPEFDTSGLNSDIILDAVYTPWVTLVASGEQEGKLALALAEGRFTEETVLRVQPPSGLSSTAVGTWWNITLEGTDLGPEDEVTLRILNPTEGRAEVWEFRDGWRNMKRVDAKVNGSYLIFTMTGTSGDFQIVPAQGNAAWLLLPAAGIALLLLSIRRIRKKRQNKTAKPST